MEVMLICGVGVSSGLVAQAIRKQAKKKKLDINVFAKSESEIKQYITKIDALLISPHYKTLMNDEKLLKEAEANNVHMMQISSTDYGKLDGAAVLAKLLEEMEK